jgi:hypothetical protein
MATMSRDPAPQPLADDGSSNLLLEVGRTIRDNFHILAGLSLLYLAVALPFVIFATVTSWAIAVAPLVLVTAPVWMAIVASADRMLAAEGTPWRSLADDLRRLAWPAVRIGIVPALCGSLLLAIAGRNASSPLHATLLVALGGGAVAIVVLLIPAVPIAARTGVSGLTLWQASAFVALRRPAQVLGTVTLAGIGIWLTFAFGPAALLGVAPLGVLVAAITMPDPG